MFTRVLDSLCPWQMSKYPRLILAKNSSVCVCVCHVAYKSGLYPDFLSQYRELVSPFIPSMSKLVRTLCSDSLLMLKHLHYSQYIVVVCCRMQDDTIKIDWWTAKNLMGPKGNDAFSVVRPFKTPLFTPRYSLFILRRSRAARWAKKPK